MATTAYLVVKLLHVLAAAIALGALAVTALWRWESSKRTEPGALRHTLETILSMQKRLVHPALGVLILTGLLLVFGPLSETYDLTRSRWAQGATLVGLVFAFLLASGLTGPVKKMLGFVERGEGDGPAMDKLWADWRTSLIAASLLGLVSVGLMVYRPGV